MGLPTKSQTARLMELAEESHFQFRVITRAPMIERPYHTPQGWIQPIQMETGTLPAHALQRIQAIYAAGIRPRGWLIAHESAQALPPAQQLAQKIIFPDWIKKWGYTALMTLAGALVVGVLLYWTVLLLIALVPVLVTALVICVIVAAALDPVLICVTEDGYWVEVDRWT